MMSSFKENKIETDFVFVKWQGAEKTIFVIWQGGGHIFSANTFVKKQSPHAKHVNQVHGKHMQ